MLSSNEWTQSVSRRPGGPKGAVVWASGPQGPPPPPHLMGAQSWLSFHLGLLHAAFLSTSPPGSAVQPEGLCRVLAQRMKVKAARPSELARRSRGFTQCLLLVRPGHRSARVTGRSRGRHLSRGVAGGHLWRHFRSALETGLEGSFFCQGSQQHRA